MSDERYELPVGWLWAALGEVVSIGSTQVLPKRTPAEPFNYLALEHIEPGTGRILNFTPTLGQDIGSNKFAFKVGDVLYGKLRPYLRKATVARFDGVSATDLIPLRSLGCVEASYLQRYLLSPQALSYVHPLMAGIKMPRLRSGDLRVMPIPLAPLPEQRRIVAKIEALFEESRTVRQALDRIPPLLKKFRQSVLAAAFRGDLTRDWREQHPDIGPASTLLERICAEGRRKWEEGLRAKRRHPRMAKRAEAEPMETSDLPSLPEGWSWASLEDVATIITGSTPRKGDSTNYGNSLPFVKPGDLDIGRNVSKAEECLSERGTANARLIPANSVMVTCIGATIGKTGLSARPLATNQQINSLVLPPSMDPMFVYFYCLTDFFQRCVRTNASSTTLPILNKSRFGRLPIPVAPLVEQHRIAGTVEAFFDQADAVEMAVVAARRRADKVDQSILARAFRGELVPQDPNDEPAASLLGRTHSERSIGTPPRRLGGYQARKRKRADKKPEV